MRGNSRHPSFRLSAIRPISSGMRRPVLASLIVAFAMALPGCQPATPEAPGSIAADPGNAAPGDRPGPLTSAAGASAARWPFWPTSMRIHPLTRALSDPETNQLIIEARIEFFDADEETAKAAGMLTLQVHAGGGGGAIAGAQALKTWNLDLANLTFNREHYDDVTRTYLFKLEVGQADLSDRPELRAYFLSIDGRTMEAELAVRQAK